MPTGRRILAALLVIALATLGGTAAIAPVLAQDAVQIAGSAAVSGSVEATKPFTAAQVHFMNVDKNVLFMVYTSGGRYRAVNLFPGRYEVTVRKPGFAAEPRTITLAAGATGSLDFTMRVEATPPLRQGEFGFTTQRPGEVALVSYDELYPREPSREVFEKRCLYCHGKNFFPTKQYHEAQWSHFIDVMTGVAQSERGAMIRPG